MADIASRYEPNFKDLANKYYFNFPVTYNVNGYQNKPDSELEINLPGMAYFS